MEMGLTGMGLFEAKGEFLTEAETETAQPLVMVEALTHPDRTGVCGIVDRVIAPGARGLHRRVFETGEAVLSHLEYPVGRIQELGGFQDHLHDVLVAVPSGTTARIGVQKEDIHVAGTEEREWTRSNFLS